MEQNKQTKINWSLILFFSVAIIFFGSIFYINRQMENARMEKMMQDLPQLVADYPDLCDNYFHSTLSGRIHKIRRGGGHARPDQVFIFVEQDTALSFSSIGGLAVGYFKRKIAFKVPHDQVNIGDSIYKSKESLYIKVLPKDHDIIEVNPTYHELGLNCNMFSEFIEAQ